MNKIGWYIGALLLVAFTARAQAPLLVGRWEVREISFVVGQEVADSLRERLVNSEVADLNTEIEEGTAHLIVNFELDSSYQFSITRAKQVVRQEQGAYRVENNILLARSPASLDGSSFNDQRVLKLTQRTLLLAFPVGKELPGVMEQIEYRRLKSR